MLSAALGPAGSIKWVDVGRWVSPFSPSSSPPFYFSFCLSLPSIWQIPLLPLPLPCYTLPIEMASLPHTNPRLLAQASHIPWAMSYLRFDYGRPPSRMNVLLRLSALCPDVVQIIRGKPVLPTRVITTSVANAARKLQQHLHSTGVGGGEEKDEAWHAHRSIFRGWLIQKCTSNSTNATVKTEKQIPVQGIS